MLGGLAGRSAYDRTNSIPDLPVPDLALLNFFFRAGRLIRDECNSSWVRQVCPRHGAEDAACAKMLRVVPRMYSALDLKQTVRDGAFDESRRLG